MSWRWQRWLSFHGGAACGQIPRARCKTQDGRGGRYVFGIRGMRRMARQTAGSQRCEKKVRFRSWTLGVPGCGWRVQVRADSGLKLGGRLACLVKTPREAPRTTRPLSRNFSRGSISQDYLLVFTYRDAIAGCLPSDSWYRVHAPVDMMLINVRSRSGEPRNGKAGPR